MIKRLVILFVLATTLAGLAIGYYATATMQVTGLPAEFSIHPGSTLRSVASQLHREGLLEHPYAFVALGVPATPHRGRRSDSSRARAPAQRARACYTSPLAPHAA